MRLSSLLLSTLINAESYAPVEGSCLAPSSIRILNSSLPTLNINETAYIQSRSIKVKSNFINYFGNLSSTVYGGNLSKMGTPIIGISISGGGIRAALFAAGVINSLDSRNSSSVNAGTGGLLQASSYMSALSGGAWFLSSFYFNDMPEIYEMVLGSWLLNTDLFNPSTGKAQSAYVSNIMNDLTVKKKAGFNVTFNDYWARALSYRFLPNTTTSNFFSNSTPNHAASLTFSSISSLSSYANAELPFPIIVASVLSPNQSGIIEPGELVPLSNVIYEFTPYEFGSFNPSLSAFIPIDLLGTTYQNGTALTGCVTSFDNAGFVLGTSSNLFSSYNVTHSLAWDFPLSPINQGWELVNKTFSSTQPNQQIEIAAVPNPFFNLKESTYQDQDQTQLRLIDGGLAGAVVPLGSLAVSARNSDLIIALDAAADSSSNTPIGESLVIAQAQVTLLPVVSINLPPLPKSNTTFILQGLNTRATFFGCNGTTAILGGKKIPSPYPFLVYLPNYLPGSKNETNYPTAQLTYTFDQQIAFLDATFQIATRGYPLENATSDPNWPTCLACTTVERVRGREGVDRTAACSACFDRYCWSEVESGLTASKNGSATTGKGNSTTSSSRIGALNPFYFILSTFFRLFP